MLNKFVILLCLVFIQACSSEPEFKEVKKTSIANNASLPDGLIEDLSKHFLEQNPGLSLSLKKVKAKFGFYAKREWPLTVNIWPTNNDLKIAKSYVLKDGAVRVDINRFINQLEFENEFYLKIKLKTQLFNKLFVYFLPSNKEGKSCGKFYNISTYYQKKLSEKVLLTKKNDHYIKNYLGTYVFFSALNEKTYQLNLLQITDSSLGDKLCHYF